MADQFDVLLAQVTRPGETGGGPAGAAPPHDVQTQGPEVEARQDALQALVKAAGKQPIKDLVGDAEAVVVVIRRVPDAGVRV